MGKKERPTMTMNGLPDQHHMSKYTFFHPDQRPDLWSGPFVSAVWKVKVVV